MMTATLNAKTHDIDVDDMEYLRHDDKPLLARVHKPRGQGPFPALVEVHGGGWCVQDINYAVRWAKLNAPMLKTRPDLVGLSGQSSGGHQAMLVAMRPNDTRSTAIPLPGSSASHDASVRCVVMSWPVINPFSRYRHAKRLVASGNPPGWATAGVARQDDYWQSEA